MSSLPPTPENSSSNDLVRDVVKKWSYLPIKHLIFCDEYQVVFLDNEDELDWATSDECDIKLASSLKIGELSKFRNQAAILQTYPRDHLTIAQSRNFLIMIGEGVARGHDGDVTRAVAMLEAANRYVTSKSQEVARVWYLKATYWAAGIFTFLGIIGWIGRNILESALGANATELLVISLFGALGAQFFILLRVGKTPLDPDSAKILHQIEGVGRVLVGVIGALITQLAVKVGILAPFLLDHGKGGLLLVSLVAGASEMLVPSLVGYIEKTGVPVPRNNPKNRSRKP